MMKMENIIKGLECCLNADVNDCEMDCPYFNDCCGFYSNNTALLADALALLKAQEPKPPIIKENTYGWKFYYCPSCGKEFYQNNKFSFCEKCGQAVKWE